MTNQIPTEIQNAWDRGEITLGQVFDRMAEFEFPEADPAEVDPEEAEPAFGDVFIGHGPHGPYTGFAEPSVIAGYVASGFMHGPDCYSPLPHKPSLHLSHIHGAGCEAWP